MEILDREFFGIKVVNSNTFGKYVYQNQSASCDAEFEGVTFSLYFDSGLEVLGNDLRAPSNSLSINFGESDLPQIIDHLISMEHEPLMDYIDELTEQVNEKMSVYSLDSETEEKIIDFYNRQNGNIDQHELFGDMTPDEIVEKYNL